MDARHTLIPRTTGLAKRNEVLDQPIVAVLEKRAFEVPRCLLVDLSEALSRELTLRSLAHGLNVVEGPVRESPVGGSQLLDQDGVLPHVERLADHPVGGQLRMVRERALL